MDSYKFKFSLSLTLYTIRTLNDRCTLIYIIHSLLGKLYDLAQYNVTF